ncbi:ATP-binding cassette domain-containing protein [Acidovorax sp. SUPP3434]|uniref:ABC transporter ATP-binding protein n=1 Tax=Acidovorax sp. SUPP3434 TaxID=2920880 RepID=UPI0023DE5A5B|nr:ATP-binding cassette domain-containing protein [Acidovorax sp. SUPP3434]GKS99985.1 ATP-binding cassette domain-containing protein [Acidovorax sp. SUPP3434]
MPDSTTPSATLLCDGLRFAHAQGPAVFDGFTAHAAPGATLVRGDEGSGKTTLLRLLAGELQPQGGTVWRSGRVCSDRAEKEVGAVFWADPRATALDGTSPAAWFGALASRHPAWDASALQAHVAGFGLESHLPKAMEQLSTGTRRKALLAAAFACGAPLVLVDEPVAGLDRPSVQYLQQVLAQRAAQGGPGTVLVAHYDALAGVPWNAVIDLP